jgi:hypothetical protein
MTSLPSDATSAIVPNSLQSLLPYGIQASSPSMKVRKKDGRAAGAPLTSPFNHWQGLMSKLSTAIPHQPPKAPLRYT